MKAASLVLSESTLIPVSLVTVTIAFTFWVAGIYNQTQENTRNIERMSRLSEAQMIVSTDIRTSLAKLDAQVAFVYETVKANKTRGKP